MSQTRVKKYNTLYYLSTTLLNGGSNEWIIEFEKDNEIIKLKRRFLLSLNYMIIL